MSREWKRVEYIGMRSYAQGTVRKRLKEAEIDATIGFSDWVMDDGEGAYRVMTWIRIPKDEVRAE